MVKSIAVSTTQRIELIDITSTIQKALEEDGVKDGVCCIFVPHSTAGITINEGADPCVKRDMIGILEKLVPEKKEYTHLEGNSDSHMKASLMGASEMVIVEGGQLLLGTWQSIYFCEFDGPRRRKLHVRIIRA